MGAAFGVNAFAVLAGTAEVGPRRRFRARRRVVERPVHRDDHLARSPQGEKRRHLELEQVVLAAPPLLLHRGHARLGHDPRRAAAATTSCQWRSLVDTKGAMAPLT